MSEGLLSDDWNADGMTIQLAAPVDSRQQCGHSQAHLNLSKPALGSLSAKA